MMQIPKCRWSYEGQNVTKKAMLEWVLVVVLQILIEDRDFVKHS